MEAGVGAGGMWRPGWGLEACGGRGGGGAGAPGLPSSLEPSSETSPRGLRKAGALVLATATWLLQPRPGCGFILDVAGGVCPVGVSPECGRRDL